MDEMLNPKIYAKAELFFNEEPDWDVLAVGLKRFRETRRFRIEFRRASERDSRFVLPLYTEYSLRLHRREHREMVELSPEDAKAEFYADFRESIERFFGCDVRFVELIPDYLHPDDLKELDEGMSRRQMSFFGAPNSLDGDDIRPEQESESKSLPISQLDELVGLESVKKQIRDLANLVKLHGKEALPCLHMVFRGNPGTGKTTVARIITSIFDDAGITSGDGTFVETDREGLVGMYVGHTAVKTKRVVKSAEGGVLFIDEAYALATYESGRDFGEEAIATLVKALEDKRDSFVCIMAGYPAEMDKLVSSNPGLRDRIGFYIDFPDYTADELYEVFEYFAKKDGLKISKAAADELKAAMRRIVATKSTDFSNARMARKVFERVRMEHLLTVGGKTIKAESVRRVFEADDMRQLLYGKACNNVGFCA